LIAPCRRSGLLVVWQCAGRTTCVARRPAGCACYASIPGGDHLWNSPGQSATLQCASGAGPRTDGALEWQDVLQTAVYCYLLPPVSTGHACCLSSAAGIGVTQQVYAYQGPGGAPLRMERSTWARVVLGQDTWTALCARGKELAAWLEQGDGPRSGLLHQA